MARRLSLAKQIRDAPEMRRRQHVNHQAVEQLEHLHTDCRAGLLLENVEQRRRHAAPEVFVVLAADLTLEVVDLLFVEEVESRIEIGEADDTRCLGFLDRRVRGRRDLL